jgi:hypothetical protein
MEKTPLRRLIDLPGMEALEHKALMTSRFAQPESRDEFPEIDAWLLETFGLTAAMADDVERPADWDDIELTDTRDQILAFEAEGWDVTNRGRALRMLDAVKVPLWLALRGVAGKLPFQPEAPPESESWGASLAGDATRFRRDRR